MVGFAAFAWLLPAHDYLVTGSMLDMPYSSPMMPGFHLGFTKAISFGPYVHSPTQAIGNLVGVIQRLDLWALAWPASLVLVIAGAVRRAPTRGDRILRWTLGSFVAFYIIVPFPGTWDLGPTYYYALVPVVIPLAVRGVSASRAWLGTIASIGPVASRMVGWIVIVGMVVAVTAIAPIRAIHITTLASEIRAPWEVIEASDIADSIVIVPRPETRKAPGWAQGYPYTLTSARGATVHLIMPSDQHELEEAVAFLGPKPVYVLELDSEHYTETGTRVFRLVPLK